jgi:hypothetical protein
MVVVLAGDGLGQSVVMVPDRAQVPTNALAPDEVESEPQPPTSATNASANVVFIVPPVEAGKYDSREVPGNPSLARRVSP